MLSRWNKVCTYRFCPSALRTGAVLFRPDNINQNEWSTLNHEPLNQHKPPQRVAAVLLQSLQLESFIISKHETREEILPRSWKQPERNDHDDYIKMNLMHIWQTDMMSEQRVTSVCMNKHLPQWSIFTLSGQISGFCRHLWSFRATTSSFVLFFGLFVLK